MTKGKTVVCALITCLGLALTTVCVQAVSLNDVSHNTIPAITTDDGQNGVGTLNSSPAVAVPEGSTISMLILGFGGLGGLMWLRRRRA